MTFDERASTLTRDEIAALLASHEQLTTLCTELTAHNAELTRQLEWFKHGLVPRLRPGLASGGVCWDLVPRAPSAGLRSVRPAGSTP